MKQLDTQTCNFFELFGFNSKMNVVTRVKMRIGTEVYPSGFEFTEESKCAFKISEHIDDIAIFHFDAEEPDVLVLHSFVPYGNSDKIFLNCAPEKAIYRYSKLSYLEDAYKNGHFRICSALEYLKKEYDDARHDIEIVHNRNESAESVKIRTGEGYVTPRSDVIFSTIDLRTDTYILCFSYDYDKQLFTEFKDSDACLIINDVEKFAERIHTAYGEVMPSYIGNNGRVSYSKHKNPLGPLFSKPLKFIIQREYRFVWTNPKSTLRISLKDFIDNNLETIRDLIPPPIDIYMEPIKDISTLK